MPRLRARTLTAAAAAALIACGPAAGATRPAGVRPALDSVEAGLWDVSDKTERDARRSAELNPDPALNAYVRDVACAVAAAYCNDLRVYVLDRPFFNAAMAPNGYTEVWSGLLLRCEDEAELAFVLGHEVSHFAENHTLKSYQAAKTRQNVAMAISVGIAVVGAVAAAGTTDYQSAQNISNATGGLIDAVYLASIASLFRFSREQETEADMLGIRRSAAAGYRPAAAGEIWRGLMSETATSDFKRIREQDTRLGIFDSHPLSATRVSTLETEAAKLTAAPGGRPNRHRAAIRPFLGAWLKDDLRRRDYGETLHIVARLSRSGEDLGVLNFYRGEAYRLRGQEGDLGRAVEAYRAATEHADVPLAAWRELGEARRRTGDPDGARTALETYLTRAPEAEDAWMVRETLDALSKGD